MRGWCIALLAARILWLDFVSQWYLLLAATEVDRIYTWADPMAGPLRPQPDKLLLRGKVDTALHYAADSLPSALRTAYTAPAASALPQKLECPAGATGTLPEKHIRVGTPPGQKLVGRTLLIPIDTRHDVTPNTTGLGDEPFGLHTLPPNALALRRESEEKRAHHTVYHAVSEGPLAPLTHYAPGVAVGAFRIASGGDVEAAVASLCTWEAPEGPPEYTYGPDAQDRGFSNSGLPPKLRHDPQAGWAYGWLPLERDPGVGTLTRVRHAVAVLRQSEFTLRAVYRGGGLLTDVSVVDGVLPLRDLLGGWVAEGDGGDADVLSLLLGCAAGECDAATLASLCALSCGVLLSACCAGAALFRLHTGEALLLVCIVAAASLALDCILWAPGISLVDAYGASACSSCMCGLSCALAGLYQLPFGDSGEEEHSASAAGRGSQSASGQVEITAGKGQQPPKKNKAKAKAKMS